MRPAGDDDRDGAPGGGGEAVWPAGRELPDELAVRAACVACGLAWRIHRSLAGFRLRCRCDAWVDVPGPAPAAALPAAGGAGATALAPSGTGAGLPARHPIRSRHRLETWDGRPLVPDAGGVWTLRHASVDTRRRWIDRTLIELVLMVGAFVVPALVVHFAASGRERALWLPIADVASGLLVLVAAQSHRGLAFEGLRGASIRHFAEAAVVTAAMVGLARLWLLALQGSMPDAFEDQLAVLRDSLGVPMTLFVVGLTPGIFEELAFRGLIQGRLAVLTGPVPGALIGGVTFALAHGVTACFPIHALIGVYLSFLRLRSRSLLPGMLLHFSYNSALVLLA